MRKFLPYIFILVILIGVPLTTHAQVNVPINPLTVGLGLVSFNGAATSILNFLVVIANGVLQFMSWITGFAGAFLDYVLNFTIVNMKLNVIGDGTTANPGISGINTAWKIIKDLMNIAFIFILVFEGIKLIIGQGSREGIKNFIAMVVLASLLINFSLFFTKVLIDASNIITIGVYKSITANPVQGQNDLPVSEIILKKLQLQSIYDTQLPNIGANGIGGAIIFMLGSSAIFIIATFVLFSITFLFIIRYIVLIILLMLSPVAYMGMALPMMKGYASQWWESLKGQLIFAPVFMIMLMISIVLMDSPGFIKSGNFAQVFQTTNQKIDNGTGRGVVNNSNTNGGIILSYILVIALLLASLTLAKSTASKGSKLIGEYTGKFTNFAGGAIFGGSAWALRKSAGNIGNRYASDADLQRDAKDKAGFRGAWARTKLYTARTARDATYDARNASIPTSVIGDTIEGTVGRTKYGKAVGLNDVNISNIEVGGKVLDFGKGGTKSYVTESTESTKRVRDRETANATELALAEAKKDILAGSQSGATPAQIDAMEKALSKLSDKQTEALVEGNRQLLTSLNFANSISVKQLEALNKSDQFSDSEKGDLKNARFNDINNAMLAGTTAAIAGVRSKIRDLSDSELDMIDSAYLGNDDFVSHLKPGQVETINKSNKFTTNQKTQLRNARMRPLMNALTAGNIANIQTLIRKVDYKTLVSYMNVPGRGGVNIALDPAVLPTYNPKILTRMADEMNDADKMTLKTAILAGGNAQTITWLNDPDKGGTYFI